MDWPELRNLVFVDPLLFDLARFQLAADLVVEPSRPLSMYQESELVEHAAHLLRSSRPRPGQGAVAGGAAVRALVYALLEELQSAPWLWNLAETGRDPNDPWFGKLTLYAFTEELSERLNRHPHMAGVERPIEPGSIRSLFQLG
jgi:hypothetical protein